MNKLSKKGTVMLIFLLFISCLLLVEPSIAPVNKPTTPTFTLQEIAQPCDVPPTTTTIVDPYTGEKTTITHPGYHVENKTICLKIKNQSFTQYTDDGTAVKLYYKWCYKGHYSDDTWNYPYPDYIEQTDSEYTLIHYTGVTRGQVDVRVKAMVGILTQRNPFVGESGDREYFKFEGIEGDWSNTQTLTFDPLASSPILPSSPTNPDPLSPLNSNNPPPSQTTPQQTLSPSNRMIILVYSCIIAVLLSVIAHLYIRQRKQGHLNVVGSVGCKVKTQ